MIDDAVYLYALARRGTLAGLDIEGVEEGRRVAVIACGGLDAVVSDVPRAAYEAACDPSATAELAWVVPRAVRHDCVVRAVAAAAPALPARFGAVFSSEMALSRLVVSHAETIASFLDNLAGKGEWSVRVWTVPASAADGLLATDPELAARHARLPASAGARYFAEKRLREEALVAARRSALAAARSVRARLVAVAAVRDLPLRKPEPSGREMIVNLACLLDDAEAESLLSSVRTTALEEGPPGLEFETEGPWPAFHFCPDLAEDRGTEPTA